MRSTVVAAPPLPDVPYRGIEPFRYVDRTYSPARPRAMG
jgi:hypothetical protein